MISKGETNGGIVREGKKELERERNGRENRR